METEMVLIGCIGSKIQRRISILCEVLFGLLIVIFEIIYYQDVGLFKWMSGISLIFSPLCFSFIFFSLKEKRFWPQIFGFILGICFYLIARIDTACYSNYPKLFLTITVVGFVFFTGLGYNWMNISKLYLKDKFFVVQHSEYSFGIMSMSSVETTFNQEIWFEKLVCCCVASGFVQIHYTSGSSIIIQKFRLLNLSEKETKEIIADKISNVKLRVLDELI